MRRWHLWPALLMTVLLGAACAATPPEPDAVELSAAIALSPAELEAAQRQRSDLLMRADPAWVTQVATDPRAEVMLGILMLPDERAAMRTRLQDGRRILPRLIPYAARHAGTWAGATVDMDRGGIIVVRVSAALDMHQAAVRDLIGDDAVAEVVLVEWSEAELRRFEATVDTTWLDRASFTFRRFGVDIEANRVELMVSSRNPDAVAIIRAHYGDPPWLVVGSERTGFPGPD